MIEELFMAIFVVFLVIAIIFLWAIGGAIIGAFAMWWITLIPPLRQMMLTALTMLGFEPTGKLIAFGALVGFIAGILGGSMPRHKDKS